MICLLKKQVCKLQRLEARGQGNWKLSSEGFVTNQRDQQLEPKGDGLWNNTVAETSNRETKHHTQTVGELRFIMLAGPKELRLEALSPEPRGYRVFKDLLEWATLAANSLV